MKRVITYGTFDLFHKGHYNIIKRAKALGDYLIVGVTSESFDIERGKLNVRDSLIKRIENVRRTGLADEIIIEEYQGQKVNDIIKYDIDVLVVGSDWRGKFDYLKNYCDVVYLERTKNISSTKLRSEGVIFNMGIVTDDIRDNDFVEESKYVSGVHVERVFSEDHETAQRFCDKYELGSCWNSYDEFLAAMRREGYEFAVSKAEVLYHTDERGKLQEPMEIAYIDVPEEFSGTVIQKLSERKGELQGMSLASDGSTVWNFTFLPEDLSVSVEIFSLPPKAPESSTLPLTAMPLIREIYNTASRAPSLPLKQEKL